MRAVCFVFSLSDSSMGLSCRRRRGFVALPAPRRMETEPRRTAVPMIPGALRPITRNAEPLGGRDLTNGWIRYREEAIIPSKAGCPRAVTTPGVGWPADAGRRARNPDTGARPDRTGTPSAPARRAPARRAAPGAAGAERR